MPMSATSIVAIIEPSSIGEVRAGNRELDPRPRRRVASKNGRIVRAGEHEELLHS
jgi:hypothetical protein